MAANIISYWYLPGNSAGMEEILDGQCFAMETGQDVPLQLREDTCESRKNDHGIRSHHFKENRWENNGNSDRLYFFGAPKITVDGARN